MITKNQKSIPNNPDVREKRFWSRCEAIGTKTFGKAAGIAIKDLPNHSFQKI